VFDQHLTPLIIISAAATGLVFFLIPLLAYKHRSPTLTTEPAD
jgi:hypothetical protein